MSQDDFDRLGWGAGSDGASVMVWPMPTQERPEDDYDQLMEAWLAERGRVVEAELLLARARDALTQLNHPRAIPSGHLRREIRRLLGEIDDQLD